MIKIDVTELTGKQMELVEAAMAVRENAYCPYSKFKVGAALRDENGAIHTGCNIESVDFTLTSHAEMVAVDSMVKSGVKNMREIAIVVKSNALPVPCGLCRQKMSEFSGSEQVSIICVNLDNDNKLMDIFITTLDNMLPYAFKAF